MIQRDTVNAAITAGLLYLHSTVCAVFIHTQLQFWDVGIRTCSVNKVAVPIHFLIKTALDDNREQHIMFQFNRSGISFLIQCMSFRIDPVYHNNVLLESY